MSLAKGVGVGGQSGPVSRGVRHIRSVKKRFSERADPIFNLAIPVASRTPPVANAPLCVPLISESDPRETGGGGERRCGELQLK